MPRRESHFQIYYQTIRGENHEFHFFFFVNSQEIVTPDVLYEDVVEVDERVVLQQERCEIKRQCPSATGTTGEKVVMGIQGGRKSRVGEMIYWLLVCRLFLNQMNNDKGLLFC